MSFRYTDEKIPDRPAMITISSNNKAPSNPLDPSNLEHIERTTLREARKEERAAQKARELDNLLDLRDI